MRQIEGGSGGIKGRDRALGRAPRAALGQSTVGILRLCQEANTADVLNRRPFARRPLAANCCGVHRSGPGPATRPRGGVMEGGCLCLDLGEERGIFSRPEPTTGARRPHAFRRQYREEGHKTLVPAAPSRSLELLAGAPSRRANWPIALCTHPQLRRERCRCDPAITVKIEANRGRYRRQRFAAIGLDDWLASAIACLDRHGGIPALAPAVTKLVVDEFSQDLARPIPIESGSRCEPRLPVR